MEIDKRLKRRQCKGSHTLYNECSYVCVLLCMWEAALFTHHRQFDLYCDGAHFGTGKLFPNPVDTQ